MLNNTAILLFSRLPEQEIFHKKISCSNQADLGLWQHLYKKTLLAAKKTNLPIISCTEKSQEGKNFAEKITYSIEQAFKQGFENIIVIGGDCAGLTTKHIATAYHKLINGNSIVAGQDSKAGVYLLGLNKKCYNKKRFLQFSWQTNKLFKELHEYGNNFSFSKLPAVLIDVNTKEDVIKCSNLFNICVYTKRIFLKIIGIFIFYRKIVSQNIQTKLLAFCNILRGPPALN